MTPTVATGGVVLLLALISGLTTLVGVALERAGLRAAGHAHPLSDSETFRAFRSAPRVLFVDPLGLR